MLNKMEPTAEAIEDQNTMFKHIKRLSTTFASKPKEAKIKWYVQIVLDQIMNLLRDVSYVLPYISNDVYYECYDTYISFKTSLLDLSYEFESPQSPIVHAITFATGSRNEPFTAGARLRKINLPTFSGDYLQWISYRDTFRLLVHQSPSLMKI